MDCGLIWCCWLDRPCANAERRSSVTTVFISSHQMSSSNSRMSSSSVRRTPSSSGGELNGNASSERLVESHSTSSVTEPPDCRNTLMEAVNTGLLDLHRGVYIDPLTGTPVLLNDAVNAGLIDAPLCAALQQPLGVKDPRSGGSLSLLAAVQQGIYDLHAGRFVNPTTGQAVEMEEAVASGFVLRQKVRTESSSSSSITITNTTSAATITSASTTPGTVLVAVPAAAGSTTYLEHPPCSGLVGSVERVTFQGSASVSDGVPASCLNRNQPPPEGWLLKDAISFKLLDPVSGLFAVPGTDRLVSLEECVRMNIIHPHSATVIDPSNNRSLTLNGAFDLKILTPVGCFTELGGQTLNLLDAIQRNHVRFEEISPLGASRSLQLKETLNSQQEFRQESASKVELVVESVRPSHEPPADEIRVAHGVTFSRSTGRVSFSNDESMDLLTAVIQNKVLPGKVKVKDPTGSGKELSIAEAIRKGIISKDSGEYKSSGGRKLSMIDALQSGIIAVDGRPLDEPEVEEVESKGWEEVKIKLIDPFTGADITWESAIQRKTLDIETVLQFRNPDVELTEALTTSIICSDVETGKQISVKSALEQNILTEKQVIQLVQEQLPVSQLVEANPIPSQPDITKRLEITKKPEITNEPEITKEPEFSMAVGCASGLTSSPIKLQRIRRKITAPEEAVLKRFIDESTAALLRSSADFKNRVDLDSGAICDVFRGQQLTIREALDRRIMDSDSGELQFPTASPLSLAEAIERGLYEKASSCFIHPENGIQLTLTEALECEVIDPLSQVFDIKSGRVMAISAAIAAGIVDPQSGSVGLITFPEAVSRELFKSPEESFKSRVIPPVGLTLPASLKRKLIDTETAEFIHPFTGERTPLPEAIRTGLITAIPYPTAADSVELTAALNNQMLDLENQTFTNASGQRMPLSQALERGVLHIQQELTGAESTSAEIVTKPIQLVAGFSLITGNGCSEVKNERTGDIMTLSKAEKLGLVIDAQSGSGRLTIQDAIDEGCIQLDSGPTYNPPGTNVRMSITQALNQGLIQFHQSSPVVQYRVPADEESVTAGTVIYDSSRSRILDVGTAVESEILSPSGDYIDSQSDCRISFTDAINAGLVAVLGIPIAASAALPDGMDILNPALDRIMFKTDQSSIETGTIQEPESKQIEEENASSANTESVRHGTISISAVDILDPTFAIQEGWYDASIGSFIDTGSKKRIRFTDAVALGILDGTEILVKDGRCNSVVTLSQALDYGLVDPETGHMVEPKTGTKIPFFEAVQSGWIEASPEAIQAKLPNPVSFASAVAAGDYDMETGFFRIPQLRKSVSLSTAIQQNWIDPDSLIFRAQSSGEDLTLAEAIQRSLMDPTEGTVCIRPEAKSIDFSKAVALGILQPKRRSISLEAAIRTGIYDCERVIDPVTRKSLTVEESVRWGIIDAHTTQVMDVRKNQLLPLDAAIVAKLIDGRGRIKDTSSGTWMDLESALDAKLLGTNLTSLSIFDAMEQGLYDPATGTFRNPFTGIEENLQQAIESGLIDGSSATIHGADGQFRPLKDLSIPLDEAVRTGVLLPVRKALSLQEAVALNCYEKDSGLFQFTGSAEKMSLQAAINSGMIKTSTLCVKDPRSGDILTLADAIHNGIIDVKSGTTTDPSCGAEMDFVAAVDRGFIIPAKRKLSVTEAVMKGIYDSASGKFIPAGKTEMATAIRSGALDSTSNLVRNPATGVVLTFDQAVADGLVDVESGTLEVSSGERIDFEASLEAGLLVEVQRPLSVTESIIKEVFNPETGLLLDPLTGNWITLTEAIRTELIDPQSVHVRDTRSDFLRKISLISAIDLGLVNGETSAVRTESGSECTLMEAFTSGLIVDSRAPVSIQRMIHQGLYDTASGRVVDPNSGQLITIHEAIRRFIVNPNLPCYFDAESQRPLSLVETCRNSIINRKTGQLNGIPLDEALERGLLLDIEKPFPLYDALRCGFFNAERNCFVHPLNGNHLNLDAAIRTELIDPSASIVKDDQSGRFMKLEEAIRTQLMDPIHTIYHLPDGDITLLDALNRKLIVTSASGLTLEEAIRNGLYSPETGKFIDPSIGDALDLNQSLEHGLIDGSTSALPDGSGVLMSLACAIESGIVDGVRGKIINQKTQRSMSLSEALDAGLIRTVERPLTFDAAIRDGSMDVIQRSFTDPRSGSRVSLEEAIRMEMIDPESAVVKDPRTGHYVTVKRALTDGIIDLKRQSVLNPHSGRMGDSLCIIFEQGTVVFHQKPLTLDEAIEKDLFRLDTARFRDGAEELNLKEAVASGRIDPDSALVKDNIRKEFRSLSVAFDLGLIHPHSGLVLNNSCGQQVALTEALASGLVVTPARMLPLIEALQFGLYNPECGSLSDPFSKKSLSLAEAIGVALIDPASTLVKDPHSGRIVGLVEAIQESLVDATLGRMDQMTLTEALDRRLLLTAEARVSRDPSESFRIPSSGSVCYLVCVGLRISFFYSFFFQASFLLAECSVRMRNVEWFISFYNQTFLPSSSPLSLSVSPVYCR